MRVDGHDGGGFNSDSNVKIEIEVEVKEAGVAERRTRGGRGRRGRGVVAEVFGGGRTHVAPDVEGRDDLVKVVATLRVNGDVGEQRGRFDPYGPVGGAVAGKEVVAVGRGGFELGRVGDEAVAFDDVQTSPDGLD